MGNIVLLDELTINKIAAGEVIERPASAIKEMVENSIDAGAKHITVEIKNGGISFIRITDDGKGIAKDDMELAFEPHATSKIRSADDLNLVTSMGFRGEALSTIAATANVELVSKTEEQEIGNRIMIQGGDVLFFDEIGCSKGTTITVKNLFFNTPARYKFLKKDFTEAGYVEDVLTRVALIHPEIAIKFINSGKTIIQTNGSGDLKSVIYNIFGKETASNIINVDYEYEDMKITGIIGKSEIARSNRANQIFFVNKRYIKDKTLSSAVEQAYKGMLPIGKFAFVVLNIEMSPSKVDVNVHPAKLEVRFEEENLVFKAMFHSIKDTLLKEGLISERERAQEIKEKSKDVFKIENAEEMAQKTYTVENNTQTTSSMIEDIFKKRDEGLKQSKPALDNSISNEEVFKKLKLLQENLKKEVEQDPSLKLTDNYKQMEQKYNETIATIIEQKSEEENVLEDKDTTQVNKEEVNKNSILEQMQRIMNKHQEIKDQDVDEIQSDIKENKDENQKDIDESNTNEEKVSQDLENKEDTNTDSLQEGKEKILNFEKMYKDLFGKKTYGENEQEDLPKEEENNFYTIDSKMEDTNVSMFEAGSEYNKLEYKFIGIAFNTYIIFEIKDEIYIMDQHAAHERIMYEKVKENFYKQGEKSSQLLLLPDVITLTHKEMDIAKDNFSLFREAGFILEEFGENTIKLSGVPDVCIDLNTQELFKETLDEINTVARTAKQEKEERFIATVACKAAVKANMKLAEEEVKSLMDRLLELQNPFTCPHGRPTVIKLSKYEIERKFARK